MDKKRIHELLAQAKSNRVSNIPIVESDAEPNTIHCLWLKSDGLYAFEEGKWQLLTGSEGGGGDTPEEKHYVELPLEFKSFTGTSNHFTKSEAVVVNQDAEEISNYTGMEFSIHDTEYSEDFKMGLTFIEEITETSSAYNRVAEDLEMDYSGAEILHMYKFVHSGRLYPTYGVLFKDNGQKKFVCFLDEATLPAFPQTYEIKEMDVNEVAHSDESKDMLKVFPIQAFPIKLTPMVFRKSEYDGNTYAYIGMYAGNFDYNYIQEIPESLKSVSRFLPVIINNADIEITKSPVPTSILLTTTADLGWLPIKNNQQVITLYFEKANSNFSDYYMYITADPNNEGKYALYLGMGETEISGTGLTDEQILVDYFDLNTPEELANEYFTIDLHYNDGDA